MSLLKFVLIGGAVAGVGYVVMKKANAASTPNTSVPPGYTPPASATVVQLAPNSVQGIAVPLTLASWPADVGQPAGGYMLIWNTQNPQSFVALFYPAKADGSAGSTPAMMSMGKDADSQLMLNQLAAISAAVQAKNVAS